MHPQLTPEMVIERTRSLRAEADRARLVARTPAWRGGRLAQLFRMRPLRAGLRTGLGPLSR